MQAVSALAVPCLRGYKFCRGRSVAQPGRAPSSGGGGRRFKSSHSDQLFPTFTIVSSLNFIANAGKRLFTGDGRAM
jgi:hypothetical protein